MAIWLRVVSTVRCAGCSKLISGGFVSTVIDLVSRSWLPKSSFTRNTKLFTPSVSSIVSLKPPLESSRIERSLINKTAVHVMSPQPIFDYNQVISKESKEKRFRYLVTALDQSDSSTCRGGKIRRYRQSDFERTVCIGFGPDPPVVMNALPGSV